MLYCRTPEGLEDVSRYPYLFAELLKDPSWTEVDLKKLAGGNFLRVFREVEQVRVLPTFAPQMLLAKFTKSCSFAVFVRKHV